MQDFDSTIQPYEQHCMIADKFPQQGIPFHTNKQQCRMKKKGLGSWEALHSSMGKDVTYTTYQAYFCYINLMKWHGSCGLTMLVCFFYKRFHLQYWGAFISWESFVELELDSDG